jgi:eukaryotic-like serine/threonine-protein kinase
MFAEGDCPGRDLLTSLLLGTLPPEQEESITRHLEGCPACEVHAQQLEQTTDPLIDALRQPGRAGPATPRLTQFEEQLPDPVSLPLPGYRILREIGRGGMGVVYHAVQTRLDRPVAIKMILTGRLAGPEDRVRFLMEGELLARLSHPNFVHIYEVGTIEIAPGVAQPYLVLEYVDGGNLRARMAKGPLPVREAAAQLLVLARAIEAAHAQGIIHRDLKPANVLIARDGTPKISDFGLAKELGAGSSLTPTGLTLGTPDYMAPEQARGDPAIGPAADIYALGAIFYEMLTGKPPFGGTTPVAVILQVLEQSPVSASRIRPAVPRDLATICQKCLEKDPRRRYSRAADLADDLQDWLDDRPIRARPAGRTERAVKWARRHPLPAALIILLGLSVVTGTAASTYFGVSATRRASDVQTALIKEQEARRTADHRTAQLQLASGQALAADGQVDHGMFVMLRALESVPSDDDDLRGTIRLNLEEWLPHLPRLRWFKDGAPGDHRLFLENEIIRWTANQVFVDDPATGHNIGSPRDFSGQSIIGANANGRLICTRTDQKGSLHLRIFDRTTGAQVGATIDDQMGDQLRRPYP